MMLPTVISQNVDLRCNDGGVESRLAEYDYEIPYSSSNAGRLVGGGDHDKKEVSTVKFIASCVKFIVDFSTKVCLI